MNSVASRGNLGRYSVSQGVGPGPLRVKGFRDDAYWVISSKERLSSTIVSRYKRCILDQYAIAECPGVSSQKSSQEKESCRIRRWSGDQPPGTSYSSPFSRACQNDILSIALKIQRLSDYTLHPGSLYLPFLSFLLMYGEFAHVCPLPQQQQPTCPGQDKFDSASWSDLCV